MSDYESLIQTGIAISGIVGGLIGGHYLTISSERRKEKQELEKIRYLLNADYTLVNRQVEQGKRIRRKHTKY